MSENQNARMVSHARPQNTPNRKPLGDMSPNVRQAVSSGALGAKSMPGSPLKRSFTAAMSDSQGLQYLKRRKLSGDTPLSQVSTAMTHSSSHSVALLRDEQAPLGSNAEPVLINKRHDDMPPAQAPSQTTLPQIQEETPTEPGTPTGSDCEDNGQGSSGGRKSFSSLINYDPSSQPIPSIEAHSSTKHHHQPGSRPLDFAESSLATILRLRLQLAMYKVKTDQINVPFHDLQIDAALVRIASRSSSPRGVRGRIFTNLRPGPVLRPTAYSSRMIYSSSTLDSSPDFSHHGPGAATLAK